MTTRRQPGAPSLLLLASGFGLWALAFAALYGMLSVGCAFGWQEIEFVLGLTLQRVQLLLLFVIVLLAHAALLFRLKDRPRPDGDTTAARFVRTGSSLAAVAALAASAFTFLGVVILSSCAP